MTKRGTRVGILEYAGRAFAGFTSREHSFNLIVAIVIGLIGGYGAVGFRWCIAQVELLSYRIAEPTVEALLHTPWYLRLLLPVVGGLIVGPIVHFFASEAKGHGVPEVMAAVARRGGVISGRVAAAKVVASAVTIGTGGSAGSEGPIVQIGSSLASVLGRLMHVSARRLKIFVGCGAAAGIAATFNAPVAGMLFSVEVILGDFGVSQLSPIIVSAVAATAISRYYLGNVPAFGVPEYTLAGPTELLYYALLGAAAAIVAVVFVKALDGSETWFERLSVPGWLKPALGGLGLGIVGACGLPHVYGVGYEFIEEALLGHLPLMLLMGLMVAKILATCLTLGSGGSGGILAPALFLGAMLGGVIWYPAHLLTPDIVSGNYGPYALVGMAAVLAAATRAPLQAILILFELTGGYKVILPLMLSSILATIIAGRLMKESIYTVKLAAKGIHLDQGRDINILAGIQVREIMHTEVVTVPYSMRVQNLLELMSEHGTHATFCMLDADGQLAGTISYPDIRRLLFDVEHLAPVLRVEDIANVDVNPMTPNDTLDMVLREFAEQNIDEIPVVSAEDRKQLIGSVMRSDVVAAYHNAVACEDLLGGVESGVQHAMRMGRADMAPGYTMAEIEVPAHFHGRSLSELDLRKSKGLEVVLVLRHSAMAQNGQRLEQLMPGPDLRLQDGDRMVIHGRTEDVARLQKA